MLITPTTNVETLHCYVSRNFEHNQTTPAISTQHKQSQSMNANYNHIHGDVAVQRLYISTNNNL